jgi:hypothetical protein|tara:strand:- start:44 stop:412 length:369 start_codon:yes stop_codon:yes gene_type:complete
MWMLSDALILAKAGGKVRWISMEVAGDVGDVAEDVEDVEDVAVEEGTCFVLSPLNAADDAEDEVLATFDRCPLAWDKPRKQRTTSHSTTPLHKPLANLVGSSNMLSLSLFKPPGTNIFCNQW